MARLPSRSELLDALRSSFDSFLHVTGNVSVPTPVRLACWRMANRIGRLLFPK